MKSRYFKNPENVLLSRIDSIGDVVLALPVAGVLKQNFPDIKIALIGASYTRAIVEACEHIDEFIDVTDFVQTEISICGKKPQCIIHLITNPDISERAAKLQIPVRIGTMSRFFHWKYCNELIWLSRTYEGFHEIDGNLKLLKPYGINKKYSHREMSLLYGLTKHKSLKEEFAALLHPGRFNVILHPKSRGNSREWPVEHFINLINLMDPKIYNVFISGVESEKEYVQQIVDAVTFPLHNIAGRIPLDQFISFIVAADALVSNSTGPLHIAAAVGNNSIGIYPSLRGKNPARWGPIGTNAHAFALPKKCTDCKYIKEQCACIESISPFEIKKTLDELIKK